MNATTERLNSLLQTHADAIERAVDRYGLPLHVMFLEQIAENARAFSRTLDQSYPNAFAAFAVKSNPCRGAVRAAAALGLGADVASENELRLALEEGIPPDRIICNGNAKSSRYLTMATQSGCLVAVDNMDELHELESQSASCVDILLRFRGMPLSGLTSDDQTTAADWTKFGFHIHDAPALFSHLAAIKQLRFRGVSAHIGTQIAEPHGYERLLDHLLALTAQARAAGLTPDVVDIGGGFPVAFLSESEWRGFQARLLQRLQTKDGESVTWNDLPLGYQGVDPLHPHWVGKAYWSAVPQADMLSHLLHHESADGRDGAQRLRVLREPLLVAEPGRSLMASAGVTLSEVAGTKIVLGHHVVSLDLGINNHGTNLISPDMFPAAVLPHMSDDEPIDAFLAGRLCFSGDMISKTKVKLNRRPRRGDRFVIYYTGAYGADHFASNSCGFLRPGKIAVRKDGTVEVWRAPERFEDIFGSLDDGLLSDDGATSSS